MTPEKAKYLAENMELRSRTDRLWLNNPVVLQGLGLAPLVVAATTGRNALILAMAVALLLTCGDGEERAEVYGCAADRQQASIVFEVAADMVRMCPALAK